MFRLEECTVRYIREAMDEGAVTSRSLVLLYMERIAKYDKAGPNLNAVLELNPDALFIAEAMDRELRAGKVRSQLHGIPILLKDNINTRDKMATSAGSLALEDNFATYDAAIVTRLRRAGAVILGKANMTEFANFMSYDMKGGYSSRGGQVKNPYNPEAEVYGSSSGSAVAVAANLCALAVGTETNGSILAPAYINGVVGLKPTRGLVSRHGIIPISVSQDIAGPMTRTVADAAALLTVMAGTDPEDPSTWNQPFGGDYTDYLDEEGLAGVRVGVNRGFFDDPSNRVPIDEEIRALFDHSLDLIAGSGAELVDGADIPHLRRDLNVMLYEFRKCLDAYLATCSPALKNRSLADIIAFCEQNPDRMLKYGMGRLTDAQNLASGTLTDPVYIEDRLECLLLSQDEGLDRLFDDLKLDILVCPQFTDLAPVSGYPAICLPAGYRADGTPFGITMIARPFEEGKLIAAAYAFQLAARARRAPVLG